MSRNLQCRPLSQGKIKNIMSNNPSYCKLTPQPPPPPPVVLKPSAPKLITLKRNEEFDSLLPEENLKNFLSFARNVISRYEDNIKLQGDLEAETQDLLHFVELSENMDACRVNAMYKKLREVRRKRRACKNEIDLLKPLYDYLSDKKMIGDLAQIQGKCRTAKEVISHNRTLNRDIGLDSCRKPLTAAFEIGNRHKTALGVVIR